MAASWLDNNSDPISLSYKFKEWTALGILGQTDLPCFGREVFRTHKIGKLEELFYIIKALDGSQGS